MEDTLTSKAREVAALVERFEKAVTGIRTSPAFSNIEEADAVNEFIERVVSQLEPGLDEYLNKLPEMVLYLENGNKNMRNLTAQSIASNPLN